MSLQQLVLSSDNTEGELILDYTEGGINSRLTKCHLDPQFYSVEYVNV